MKIENVVVGGGLAGAMTALRLARAGRDVVLLEKERDAHDKVCGEFLSPEAVEYLRRAGVDPARLGAEEIGRLRLLVGMKVMEAELPFRALSLSRRVLDAVLLERAAEEACDVRRGAAVQEIAQEGGAWMARFASGDTLQGKNVFLATGKHDVRGWNREPGRHGNLVGFKMNFRLRADAVAALRGWMDLYLFGGGYGGLSLVEGGVANLCLVVRRARLRRLGDWGGLLRAICAENARVAERLEGGVALWERPLAIGFVPYGYLAGSECGMWRVGDQAAVIPSFTGDGMAIALHSGALAAEMYLAGKTPGEYAAVLKDQVQSGMALATGLSRAMVSGAGTGMARALMPALPGLVRWVARRTRVPAAALQAETAGRGNPVVSGTFKM